MVPEGSAPRKQGSLGLDAPVESAPTGNACTGDALGACSLRALCRCGLVGELLVVHNETDY
jgi:hypothetical protein